MALRRPLLWLTAAFLSGMLLYRADNRFILIAAAAFMILLLFLIRHLQRKKGYKPESLVFLLVLPVLFAAGHFRMEGQMAPSGMDSEFSAKIRGTVYGRLEMIEEKEQYTLLTLTDTIITVMPSHGGTDSVQYSGKKVIVYTKSAAGYRIGNILNVSGQIIKFQKPVNPGQFNEYQYYKIRNTEYKVNADKIQVTNRNYSKFHHYLYTLKKKFVLMYRRILPPKDSGTMSAMILGEMSLLDDELKDLYQENGISHILSISGLNVSLMGVFLFSILRKAGVHLLPATGISIFIIFSYGVLTNFSVSTNRAVVMLIVRMLADIIGRTYDLLSAASLSALIILVQSPMQIVNAGFLLSFGAIFGIALIYPALSKLFLKRNTVIDALLLSISIQCMTLPVILYFFYEFPLYALLINIIILPLSSILVLMAAAAVITACFFIPAGTFLIGCVHYILVFYEEVCRIGSELPGKTILTGRPEMIQIAAYYLVLLGFLLLNAKVKARKSIILLSALLVIFIKPKNVSFNVTFLDVGQGDGIFMEMPNGNTYLIDGGSSDVKKVGEYRIEPFLKANGIWEVDYAVISHTDTDHISGIKELIDRMEEDTSTSGLYDGSIAVRHLILPAISEKDDAYLEVETASKMKGIDILYMEREDFILEGEVAITCMHPEPDFIYNSPNAYSTVLSISYGRFDLLLTGDLEAEGEMKVRNELKKIMEGQVEWPLKPAVDYDILKVAHHGSRNSTGIEFLNMVRPEFAVISCGRDNVYGHPHTELLERLKKAGSKILMTKDSGAVRVETDGENILVDGYLK